MSSPLLRLWNEHRRLVIVGAVLLLALPLAWGRVDLDALRAWAKSVNPVVLFLATVLLPLTTFPVTPLNVIAGVRFGFVHGLMFVAGAILCQHLLAYATSRVLPRPLRERLEPLRRRLPPEAHADAIVFTVLLPGAPYWAQLYVLPLAGVPLGTYLAISAALHTLRSLTAICAGVMSEEINVTWIAVLVGYGSLLAVACYFAGKRLARRYRQPTESTEANEPGAQPQQAEPADA